MRVTRYRHGRFFAVYDAAGELVAVTVYKRGAEEVARRLASAMHPISATTAAAAAQPTMTGAAETFAAPVGENTRET